MGRGVGELVMDGLLQATGNHGGPSNYKSTPFNPVDLFRALGTAHDWRYRAVGLTSKSSTTHFFAEPLVEISVGSLC